ncbi:hypothetical protein [Anaerobranca gottschalkii]|uniref:Uncharacterized protein n=1 Tax=Anaerobranca gottschalkii DSM 13577 TaxID=1120990 RepID=A0A1H9Y577_9FIRM|nr:hypothetical protein [Anaerobranca gottschalkii]SES63877.1 hypothetical protein SAMN03080614_1001174 [Anaerobranca gottschalkii DSM 13577]
MFCPVCNSKEIGKVANNQYYCWQCFVLFNVDSKNSVTGVFEVDDEGTLVALEDY